MKQADYHPTPRRALAEAIVTVGLLAAVVAFVPLGSPGFAAATAAGCLLVAGYVVFHLARRPGAWRRWGVFPEDRDEGCLWGCWVLSALAIASLGPILAVRLLVTTPVVGYPVAYIVWCAVQDFVFFALILRNLEDVTHPLIALAATAVLFGASHYPFHEFMVLTGLVGAVWGCVYLLNRGLVLITASHWVLGVLVLA